jgi:hypothetical protein
MLKTVLVGLLLIAAIAGVFVVVKMGPSNIIGMMRYDQREEGKLHVGDRAPDVLLLSLDGKSEMRLADRLGGKPQILVFGSFT